MLSLINALLDLWDPYKIYLFPPDEYKSYAEEIEKFITSRTNTDTEELADFVYLIMPPIGSSLKKDYMARLEDEMNYMEYERFAKALLIALNRWHLS